MPKAVRFSEYGGVDVLQVVEVERPSPGPGQVLVEVRAASINIIDGAIRSGFLTERYPVTFPAGQGSDLAGVVREVGTGVTRFAVGDEVLGFTETRGTHAEFVVADADKLTERPANVSWEQAGSLFVAGTAAYAAVRAVAPGAGETVVVSAAAGGVGSTAVQLARHAGATVIGLASEANHDWLREHGIVPVAYGDGVADRIRAAANGPVHAFVDAFGADYVDLAIELGVARDRIVTVINFAAVAKHGVKAAGNSDAASAEVLAELAGLIDKGVLDVPIAAVYPLSQVREAFTQLAERHTRGKIVLTP